jgi:signal transduction histidine kinase
MSRKSSLFWSIAALLLLTVILGTALQWFLAVAVLRPLEERDARGRAEELASNIASRIEKSSSLDPTAIETILHSERVAQQGNRLTRVLYRGRDGTFASDPPGRFRAEGGPPMPGEPPPAGQMPGGPPPGGHPPGGMPAGGRPFERPFAGRQAGRIEAVARRAVVRDAEVLGEVTVLQFLPPRGLPGPTLFRTAMILLPVTALAAAIVGLVMTRLLVRRLRAIELLAARVAKGDLSVRIRDQSGDEIGRIAERLDRMTENLEEARGRIERNETQRRQLLADISHELATPLTSVRGYAETLLDPGVPVSKEERDRYVRGILDEARRLDRLTRDLFDLARLEGGAAPLQRVRLDWVELCRNTAERFEPRFRDAGIGLGWQTSLPHAWVDGDGHRLVQVLENLLGNALRYVPAGGQVELSLEPAPASRLCLTVSDNGPGVPRDELPHIFERFYRGDIANRTGKAHAMDGSGLGLAIVREIVERHGGTVRADAREPSGLRITIELPAAAKAEGAKTAGAA